MRTSDMIGADLSEKQAVERAEALLQSDWRFLIAGRMSKANGGRTFPSIDPFTEREVAQIPDADEVDANRTVDAANVAARDWRRTPLPERARLVSQVADALEERLDDFAVLDSVDTGAPLTRMRLDAHAAVETIRRMVGIASELKGSTIPASGDLHLTIREPFGVAVRIVAFNHPFLFAASKLAAPLIAGNSTIVKPSELAPMSALLMGEVLQDVLPRGTLSVVVGHGAELPRALVRHPLVRRIGFIGSAATGRSVQRDAAESGVKDVTLELGGKNALIVFPDCDAAAVAYAAVEGMNFTWSGQSCMSTSRLVVHESIADAVVRRVIELIEQRTIGSPLNPNTKQGTIVSRGQHDRIMAMIKAAQAEGAVLVTGGKRPDHLTKGLFIAPTVLDGVRPTHRIAQEEVFGPVLSVIRWGDGDDPVAIANGVEYGLTANVWTADLGRAYRVASELEVGYVWINGIPELFPGVPFGGVKNSGLGRDDGIEELMSYTTVKAVNVSLGGRDLP